MLNTIFSKLLVYAYIKYTEEILEINYFCRKPEKRLPSKKTPKEDQTKIKITETYVYIMLNLILTIYLH